MPRLLSAEAARRALEGVAAGLISDGAVVDDLGLHPMAVGELPPHLAALCRSNMAVQELAVRAVLEGSRDTAKHAVMLDPLTSATLSLDEIDSMFDEMWAAHGDQLAIYS